MLAPGTVCPECLNHLVDHEGQPHPRRYRFDARVIARALVAVSSGTTSYRNAGEVARKTSDRVSQNAVNGVVAADRAIPANLVGDWVEAYADGLWTAHGPTHWPTTIQVDEMLVHGLSARIRKARKQPWPASVPKSPKKGGQRLYSILVAEGYQSRHSHQPWAAWACPSGVEDEWAAFFRSLPGRPDVIVGDAAHAWQNAAMQVWPTNTPDLVISEFHLARMLTGHLNRLRVPLDDQAVRPVVATALDGQAEWRYAAAVLDTLADARDDEQLKRWLRTWFGRISAQISRHGQRPVTKSTGTVETTIRHIAARFLDRRALFRNRTRLNLLLRLLILNMAAEQSHEPLDERAWAKTIRAELEKTGGVPPPQRRISDHGASSLRYVPPPPGQSGKPVRKAAINP